MSLPGATSEKKFLPERKSWRNLHAGLNWRSWERGLMGWTIGVWAQPDAFWKNSQRRIPSCKGSSVKLKND